MDVVHRSNLILYKTWGLDSVLRLIGYFAKIAFWSLRNAGNRRDARKVKVIESAISEYRVVTRFTGLPDTIEALYSHLSNGSKDSVVYNAELAQHLSMVLYYPLEHISWFRDNKILKGSSDRTWRWSSQAWAVWVILEIFLQKRKYEQTESEQEKRNIRIYLVKCFSDLLLAYHWSVKKSPFSDVTVGWIGFIGTCFSLYQKWKST
mmetsp:Transcript_18289/g.23162  ORF Transcript_18289/g.23162 Transcript_18289/m.23162 type:complete len:206 (-) Transcript_18289:72-689(-)